jgi:hypothetical protein
LRYLVNGIYQGVGLPNAGHKSRRSLAELNLTLLATKFDAKAALCPL